MNTSENNSIEHLITKAKEIVEKLNFDEDLHDRKSIGLDSTIESGALIGALTKVDAIKTVQGTGKIYVGQSIQDKNDVNTRLDTLQECLKAIYDALISKQEDQMLTKAEVLSVIRDKKEDENDYYQFVGILSSLGLVTSAGRSRTGGIKAYDKTQENAQIEEAIKEIEKNHSQESQENTKAEKENVLYPSAAKEVSALGFETIIMGVTRRLSGEWNTPDVIGYRINRFKNIGGAEIEIVTVEVKWEISKLAIAESNSHQRLGHKSYLMVHQTFDEVDKSLLTELISKGIGLICKRNEEHKVYVPAIRNNPDKIDIDDFLGQALDTPTIEALKKEIAKHFYTDYFKPLLPN